jgi:hypothetical protein
MFAADAMVARARTAGAKVKCILICLSLSFFGVDRGNMKWQGRLRYDYFQKTVLAIYKGPLRELRGGKHG